MNSAKLPQPTSDATAAKQHLDEFGYCLLDSVLDADRVAAVRERLEEQAAAEVEQGLAKRAGRVVPR